MSATAAHHDLLSILIAFWANWWWAILLFGGSAVEFVAELFGGGLAALRRSSKRRYKRRLEMKRLELAIAQAQGRPAILLPPAAPAKTPGPCVHRHVTAVVAADDSLVGWLCKSCDQQLPPDWAIREEDL